MTVVIFLSVLLGAILLGIPVAFALLLCGVALMLHLDLFDAQILAQQLVSGADSFSLMAIPFFILAGEIMNEGGLSKRIIDLPMKLVGHKRGGLGFVAILAAMIMASLSGSAVADTAAVAAMLLPMMKTTGYPLDRSAGLIGTAGIIADHSAFDSVYYFRCCQRCVYYQVILSRYRTGHSHGDLFRGALVVASETLKSDDLFKSHKRRTVYFL